MPVLQTPWWAVYLYTLPSLSGFQRERIIVCENPTLVVMMSNFYYFVLLSFLFSSCSPWIAWDLTVCFLIPHFVHGHADMYFPVKDLVHWLNSNLVFKMDTWAQSNKFSTASFSGCFFIAFVLRQKRMRPLQQRLCVWYFFHRQFSFQCISELSPRVNSSLI